MYLTLTPEIIRADIEVYRARIKAARAHLEALPATASSWRDRKKLKARRKALADEIKHVQGLVAMAREALLDLEGVGVAEQKEANFGHTDSAGGR